MGCADEATFGVDDKNPQGSAASGHKSRVAEIGALPAEDCSNFVATLNVNTRRLLANSSGRTRLHNRTDAC